MKEMRDMKFFIYIIGLTAVMAGLVSCSDDDNGGKETLKTYDSMIFQAVEPDILYYSSEELKYEFIYNDSHDHIDFWRINGFNLRLVGNSLSNTNNKESFNEFLKEVGDTAVGEYLPAEAWNYRPLTKPITRIEIFADANQEPDVVKGEECSRYFEISFTSWYDYIKNGYSWDGLGTTSPTKRMSIEEFNSTPEKMLVDANSLELHISNVITDNYIDIYKDKYSVFNYEVRFHFSDGTSIKSFVNVIDLYIDSYIKDLISNFNYPKKPFFNPNV